MCEYDIACMPNGCLSCSMRCGCKQSCALEAQAFSRTAFPMHPGGVHACGWLQKHRVSSCAVYMRVQLACMLHARACMRANHVPYYCSTMYHTRCLKVGAYSVRWCRRVYTAARCHSCCHCSLTLSLMSLIRMSDMCVWCIRGIVKAS